MKKKLWRILSLLTIIMIMLVTLGYLIFYFPPAYLGRTTFSALVLNLTTYILMIILASANK
jgi:hypothetical protein